ncbi:MAG: hypothetical protein K9L21_03765 [Spirochaetia bacterium]|nr:hypothetical protein [Spirochaetia bacterium]
MKKITKTTVGIMLIGIMILVSVFSGCNLGIAKDATGSLLVSFGGASRSFDSSLDEEIASYAVTVTHSKTDEVLSDDFAKGDAIEFFELTLGTWRVDVEGINGTGTVVAEGWTDVDIVPNTRVVASVILSRLGGNGTLNVDISWPDGALENPAVTLDLYDDFAMSGDPQALTVSYSDADTDEKIEGASAVQSVPAGSYILVFSVEDADTSFTSGRFDVVHIAEGASTDVAYSVSVPTGAAGITIEDPEGREEIELSASALNAVPSSVIEFSVDNTSAESYIWGVNGSLVTGETGSTMEYTFDAAGSYEISCIANFESGAMASDTLSVDIGERDPETSAEYYAAARALLDTAVSGSESVVDLNEAYSLLNRSLALNPDNSDAALALSIMDLVGMLVDEEIVGVLRDGLGMSTYPDNYTEFYANIYSAVSLPAFIPTSSTLTSNGFNDFWENYGDEGGSNAYLPLLEGLIDYQYSDGQDAYLLQMLSNMDAAGKDLDDIFNGILQALGNSLDAVTGNLEGLGDEARFAITSDTFLLDTVAGMMGGALHYGKAEANLLAAMLYQVKSFAYLVKVVDLGFDISELLDSIAYNTSTGEWSVESDYTPFLNNFLGSDDDAVAVLAEAEAAMLTALGLMQEAFIEIAGRTADEDPAPDDALFLSPYNPMFADQWTIVQDTLAFAGKYMAELESSITSDTYYSAVLPVDGYDYNSFPEFAAHYVQNDFENWPSEPDLGDLMGPPAAVGFSFGSIFNADQSLLAMLLELDATGDPTLYTYDQETSPELAAAGAGYDPTQFYYVRMPDITLNRFFTVPLNSALIDQVNAQIPVIADRGPYVYVEENTDGSVSLYLSLDIIANGVMNMQGFNAGYSIPANYPMAFHMLEAADTTETAVPVQIWFDGISDTDDPEWVPLIFTIPMDLTSTGSFWSSIGEISNWLRLPVGEQFADLALFASGTQAEALELPIDSRLRVWGDESPFITQNPGGNFWIKYTADQAGTVVIYSNNSAWNVIDPDGIDLGEQNSWDYERLAVDEGDVFYVHVSSLAADGDLSVYCQYDDELGDISSRNSAHVLEENSVVTGRSYWNLPDDYFILAPATDAVRLTFTMPAEDAAYPYANVYFSVEEIQSGTTYQDWENVYFDSTGTGVYDYTLHYTNPDALYVRIEYISGLDYTLKWEDVGNPQ